jgi:hypothetical protein
MKYVDPTGMMTDWYLNLYKGQIEYIQGNKDLFDQALIHLAADDAKVGEIEDALTEKGYDFEKDPSVEGGYSVYTREQYQGWKMMQVFSPENVATIFFMAGEFGAVRGNIKGAGSFSKGIAGLFGKEAARGGVSKLPTQMHHLATNKHSVWTSKMGDIAKQYGLDLNGAWNKVAMPHLGRHPEAYHKFVFQNMQRAATEAGGNQAKFLQLFDQYVKQPVLQNPNLLRKSGW